MLGKFRGKVGATVFRTEAGIGQIASEYNPNPKNPRTVAQTKQRNKMNIAGQISKSVLPAMIAGFGGNGRYNRSRFVSLMLKAANSYVNPQGDVASTIDVENIKFSEGAIVPIEFTHAYDSATNKLTIGINAGANSNVSGMRIVCLISVEDNYSRAVMADEVIPASGSVNMEITIPAVLTDNLENNNLVHIFAIPIVAMEGNTSAVYQDYLHDTTQHEEGELSEAGYSASVTRIISAQSGMVASQFIGSNNIGKTA